MFDATLVFVVAIVFLTAGLIKGVVGLGLPVMSLALLTATIGLTEAMSLLIAPALVTNVWQGLRGPDLHKILRQTWPFLLAATAAVGVGTLVLTRVDLVWLSALLGGVLMFYASVSLQGVRVVLSTQHARWLGPILGMVNGLLTGMTGSFAVPGVMYFESIGLERDRLIQAMGILFTISTLALALGLHASALFSMELGLVSILAVIPAMIGVVVGQRIRTHLNEELFQRVFYVSLLLLGVYISVGALLSSIKS